MNVLVITGDKKFGPNHERYELQRSAVEQLSVVYWGSGNLWPHIPMGKFDVVTVQDPFWRGLFGWYVARRLGAKLNVQVHTDLSVYTGIKHVLMQIVLRHADSVRVVSEKIKRQVERIGVSAPIAVLPVYVEFNRFTSIFKRDHRAKNILWVGRLEDEKDPFLAIDVIKEVSKQFPDAVLTMIGEGKWKQKLSDYAANLPVVVPGWQDTAFHLETADIVLSTSKHESYGVSMIEALAAGVPVVAPDVGVAKEAGATICPREELYKGVIEVLRSGERGRLKINLLNKEEWAKAWVKTL